MWYIENLTMKGMHSQFSCIKLQETKEAKDLKDHHCNNLSSKNN